MLSEDPGHRRSQPTGHQDSTRSRNSRPVSADAAPSGPLRVARRTVRLVHGAVALTLVLLAASIAPSSAQDRSALVRVLTNSRDFRVRVQAAFALGNTRDPAVIPPLSRALADGNPAVRAAAATALGRIGRTEALPALQRASRDRSVAVRMQVARSIRVIDDAARSTPRTAVARAPATGIYPSIAIAPREDRIAWPRMRYVVLVGDTYNRSGVNHLQHVTSVLRNEVADNLRLLRGVAVLSDGRVDRVAEQEIRRRRLPKLRVDASILTMDRRTASRDVSIRAEVSLVLTRDHDRVMRGELRGAATGVEPRRRTGAEQDRRLAEQAIAGAVRSAMANASNVISQAVRQ